MKYSETGNGRREAKEEKKWNWTKKWTKSVMEITCKTTTISVQRTIVLCVHSVALSYSPIEEMIARFLFTAFNRRLWMAGCHKTLWWNRYIFLYNFLFTLNFCSLIERSRHFTSYLKRKKLVHSFIFLLHTIDAFDAQFMFRQCMYWNSLRQSRFITRLSILKSQIFLPSVFFQRIAIITHRGSGIGSLSFLSC